MKRLALAVIMVLMATSAYCSDTSVERIVNDTWDSTNHRVNVNSYIPAGADPTQYVDDADWTSDTSSHVLVGGINGTNTITSGDTGPIQVDATGNVEVVGTGTAGSAAGGVLTVQGVASMTPVLVSDGTGSLNVIVDSGSITADLGANNDVTATITPSGTTVATLNNADTTTARTIISASASNKFYISSVVISVETAGNYWLEDGDAAAITGKIYLNGNSGCVLNFPAGMPLKTPTANKALNVKGSVAGNVGVTVVYYAEP